MHNADQLLARIRELSQENDHLRASLAYSGGPCAYCKLPKEDWSKCASGFPGCGRADDAMMCPNVGAELDAMDRIRNLEAENEALKTVMIAAAEEIAAHWPAHCDADGYGPQNLLRRLEEGIASEYGYTAGAFERLEQENEALRADAARYQWLKHVPDNDEWLKLGDLLPDQLDAAIDAAMKGQK